jgi:hypothetical protein
MPQVEVTAWSQRDHEFSFQAIEPISAQQLERVRSCPTSDPHETFLQPLLSKAVHFKKRFLTVKFVVGQVVS